MKKFTIAIFSLVWLMTGSLGQALAQKSTAAVMPLAKGAGGAEFEGFGRALADMMVTDFSHADVLQLVERTQLKLVLDELKLAKSGFLSKKSAQKLGRGLGAQYIITGTFSVTGETFVLDCRIFAVSTGAIVKTARSVGTIADFVAVEKDVVEKLLVGLKVKLSLADRRKLLIDAPTENAMALASFGRGLDAQEAGKIAAAQKAFALAISKDPKFGKAGEALRSLAGSIKTEVEKESGRGRRLRAAPQLAALKLLDSEMTRGVRYIDSSDSLLDFAIRQRLLRNTEQYCQHYKELKHYLLRRKGNFSDGVAGLVPNPKGRRNHGANEARKRMKVRRTALGVTSGDTLFKERGDRDFRRDSLAIVASVSDMLATDSLNIEWRDSLFSSMVLCYSGQPLVAEFESLERKLRKFTAWKVVPRRGKQISLGDTVSLYGAYLRASYVGFDVKTRRKVDAVLARHPVGSDYRQDILKRIEGIVESGKKSQLRRFVRGSLKRQEIITLAYAIDHKEDKWFHKTPLCQDLRKRSGQSVAHHVGYHKKEYGNRKTDFLLRRVDDMAKAIDPMLASGCVRKYSKKPRTISEIAKFVKKAALRTNPDPSISEYCPDMVNALIMQANRLSEGMPNESRTVFQQLNSLRQNYQMRCLLR